MSRSDSGYSWSGAIALIVIGLVIFVPSGLCTGIMALGPIIESLLHPSGGGMEFGIVPIALMVGGPFVIGGGAMIWVGVRRILTIRREAD